MHILVTGGCGFIGSHVVDRLVADGHRVAVLDDLSSGSLEHLNKAAEHAEGDVADARLVQALLTHADAVVHLAAIASVQVCEAQPALAERTNISGTASVFAAAAARHIPVVYASSAAVYGDNPALPLAETVQARPLGAYGRHKLNNEKIATKYPDLPSVGMRFFNVYGPRQDPRSPYSGVISKFVSNAKAGLPLTFFGDGEQTRDFIYVGDIVGLIVRALAHRGSALVVNGCTGRATSLKQLAAVIADAGGFATTTQHEPARTGDIRHSLGDPAFAQQTLKFEARTTLIDGLKQLIAHA